MKIFIVIEGIITLDLIWTIIINDLRNDYELIIAGISLHCINFVLKWILKKRNINTQYLWCCLLASESVSFGVLNLNWGNQIGLAQVLILMQWVWIYNKEMFNNFSLSWVTYTTSVEYFQHFQTPYLLVKISVVFCLFLLAAYYTRTLQQAEEKKNIEADAKLIDITIKSPCYRQKILEEMPWLTEQKFFILSEQLKLLYQQVNIQALMDCPTEVNSEYDENQWLKIFLESKCETLSQNLIQILCSQLKTNKNISSSNLREICTAIQRTDNSHQKFYVIGDIQSKLLKLKGYKVNLIQIQNHFEKIFVIHLEQLLESQERKYQSAISMQQNNTIRSQQNSQNTTENSLLSNIFRSVSHEFGTYLNCIMSVSEEAISQKNISRDLIENYFEPIFLNSQLLSYILRNIRDYNIILLNQFVLRLQEFRPKDKIQEIINLMQKQIECRENKIEIVCSDDLTIHNDAERYKQIVYQLLSNAIRFTFQGSITIKVVQVKNDIIQTTVIDSGIGMNCQEAKRLNEMLKDSKKLQKISKNSVGCGLGLCISNIIAKKMSGKKGIQFNSAQNEGSTFSFTIFDSQQLYNESQHCISQTFVKVLNQTYYFECPVSQPSVKQMGMSSKFNNTIFSQNSKISLEKGKYFSTEVGKRVSFTEQMDEFEMEDNVNLEIIIPRLSTNLKTEIVFYSISSKCCSRVLLVDDEIFNITTLQLILSKFHIIADKALNGQEALKKCQAKKASPCKQCLCSGYVAIFLDLNMPIMDGFETVKELKQRMVSGSLAKAFCIANTGFADLETKQKAIAAGMDFYLTKPFEITLLEDYLRSRFPLGL